MERLVGRVGSGSEELPRREGERLLHVDTRKRVVFDGDVVTGTT